MKNRTLSFVIALMLAPLARPQSVVPPPASQPVVDIGSRRELFVDRFLIDRMSGTASLRLHRPVDRGPVLQFDAPWEGRFCSTPRRASTRCTTAA
jgi:hypothetical protein